MVQTIITGVGAALPNKKITNKDLESLVETTDEWIKQRTGIEQRYIADATETTVSLGTEAAKKALKKAGLKAEDIDLIVLATATPDHSFPSSATEIQAALGIKKGFAFDIHAVCSGFLYALNTASLYLKSNMAKKALVIGAETFSRIIDWSDRATCVLFGDGAGAVVLEIIEDVNNPTGRGILSAKLCSDGSHRDKLYVDGGISTTQTTGYLRMEGKEVFKFAVSQVVEAVEHCFKETKITGKDIDWFIPHQANKRIIDSTAKKLDIAEDKVILTVAMHGNTSAASIPLAIEYAVANNKIKINDLVLLEAVGGGFTWGAILLKW